LWYFSTCISFGLLGKPIPFVMFTPHNPFLPLSLLYLSPCSSFSCIPFPWLFYICPIILLEQFWEVLLNTCHYRRTTKKSINCAMYWESYSLLYYSMRITVNSLLYGTHNRQGSQPHERKTYRNLLQSQTPHLAYFPNLKKIKEAYEITLLSVCVSCLIF
jgi:hypothetical protein